MRAGWRKWARPGPRLRIVAILTLLAGQVQAQDAVAPLLTLDQDQFFLQSDFGKAAIERERAATAALEQENKRIEAGLVAEEQALTADRKTLPAAEFAAKAEAFDQKVESIRTEQDAKARKLTETRDADRKAFLKAAVPVLGELLGQKKATAILDKNLVILSLSAVDVTDEAIAMVNKALEKAPVTTP